MTPARRRGKAFTGQPGEARGVARSVRRGAHVAVVVLFATGLGLIGLGRMAALASTTERVVTNPRTGLAIDGFDPVAYFIDAAAEVGREDFELRHRGAIWRFRNPGNRAAFVDNPADYEPRFGGYDPVAIGRGAPTPGNAEVWLIVEQKLYLFYDRESRDEFNADPRRILMQAEARWPDVIKVLSQ
jgi:hypothetical protein